MTAHGRLVAMLDDPECVGDVLLVGLGVLACIDLHRPEQRYMPGIDQMTMGSTHQPGFRVKRAIVGDARTYKMPFKGRDGGCMAPTARKPECGRRAGGGCLTLVDYDTGERRELRYCSKHREWAYAQQAANRAAAPNPTQRWGGAPLPAANHGGVLARHFPEIDWRKLWNQLVPGGWVEHPEVVPWPKPTLTLVLGDDEPDAAGARGSLHVAPD